MSFKRASGWKIYRDQMSQLDHGDALWEPAPLNYFTRVQLGDVGYVRRGCFHLLFSAGKPLGERQLGVDVPLTFQPLDVGPIVNPQPRLPGCLSTNTVRETGASLGASICAVPMLEPGFSISFELSEKQGAALVTKYSTYREDAQREKVFEEYTIRHYDSWVAFAREGRYGDDVKPVLVSGVDMTRDFAMMAYSNNGVRSKSEFTASVPGIASVSASAWGTWRTEGLVHTNCGPQLCLPPVSTQTTDLTLSDVSHAESVSEEYSQCIFIRYYTMRKRPLLAPKVIKAGAGPHDLGPGDRDNEEPPLEVQYDSNNNSPILLGDDGDDRNSSTSTDSDSNVVFRNITSNDFDDFDITADYIFQNSDAGSVLAHHRDIELLRKTGDNNSTLTQLLEKMPQIKVDRNGVGKIQHNTDDSTKMQSDCLNVTPPTTSLVPSENEHKPANRMEVTTGAGSSADMWGSPVTTFDPILFPGDVFGQGLCFYGERVRLLPISASHQKSGDDLDAPSIKFEIAKALGTGSYTVVYQVRQVLSNYPVPPEDPWLISAVDFDYVPSSPSPVRYGQEYALKCMSKADLDKDALSAQMLEATIHYSLPTHPNIVTLYRIFETPSYLLLLLEYVPGQDLFYFLEQSFDRYEPELPSYPSPVETHTPPTPSLLSCLGPDQLLSRPRLRLISSMFTQMCQGVAACHAVNVFHRDIKPENFIVTDGWVDSQDGREERKVVVKLTDFGLSTNDVESNEMDCGSAPYMSYECRNNAAPTYSPRAADVWSLGIVLINMLYHYNPWTDAAEGACSSFEIYRQDPINFFMQRFAGMTMPVASFLATRVFCILGDSSDDSPRVSAQEFGVWAEDLPAHFSVPGHTPAVSTSSTQGHPLTSDLASSMPTPLPALSYNPFATRDSRFASTSPSLFRGLAENELPTILDNDNEGEVYEEPWEEEVQSDTHAQRSSSPQRRKRGRRKGKGNAGGLTLEALPEASLSLAREMGDNGYPTESIPPAPSDAVPPIPTVTKKRSIWKLKIGKSGGYRTTVPTLSTTVEESVAVDGRQMSKTASNVTDLIIGLSLPSSTKSMRLPDDSVYTRGRQKNSPYGSSGRPGSRSHIERWADGVEKRSVSPMSTMSGTSGVSSVASSNWRSSISTANSIRSTGTSSTAFTRYSDNSTSTVATSMSSGNWRNGKASKRDVKSRHQNYQTNPANPAIPSECCELGHGYIPQRPYVPAQGAQMGETFEAQEIFFRRAGFCGIPVRAWTFKRPQHLLQRDSRPFEGHDVPDQAILRIEWPGYPSWSTTFRTRDSTPAKNPVTLSHLAEVVCKGIEGFLDEMEAKPCTERAWRIGKATTLNVGTLGLVSLRRTSYESWMASICLMTEKHDLGDA